MIDERDELTKENVDKYIDLDIAKSQNINLNIEVFEEIDSTNEYLKRLIKEKQDKNILGSKTADNSKSKTDKNRLDVMTYKNSLEGTVAVAAYQSGGKGSRGRSFYSPKNTGVYLSAVIKPGEYIMNVTAMAAVAVARAIEQACKIECKIKWVNDIYINNKKVCGILSEGVANPDNNDIDYVICGIGINVYSPEGGFPEEIRNTAGSVFDAYVDNIRNNIDSINTVDKADTTDTVDTADVANTVDKIDTTDTTNTANTANIEDKVDLSYIDDLKSKIAAYVINEFFREYNNIAEKGYMEEYKKRSFLKGKKIKILEDNDDRIYEVKGINDEGHLVVTDESGNKKVLISGTVSVRDAEIRCRNRMQK